MSLLDEVRAEGEAIRRWWTTHLPDDRDGFHGEVNADSLPVPDADRSIILYTRLLWYFSAIGERDLADRAARYIRRHFVQNGGVVWMVDAHGAVIDAKLQGYAQAFAVYAFAEYHALTGDAGALAVARDLQTLIETRFWEPVHGGYIEALGGDQRLSDKDLDAPKTMNTHLHILEAYTRLHAVAPDAASERALCRILTVFLDRFATGAHLRLFYDMDWRDRTQSVSFGHDIEASWLLREAAEVLGDADLIARARPAAIALAQATLNEGFAAHGLAYERGFDGHFDGDGEWWGQAEGMVGFVNAWQVTGNAAFLDAAERLWAAIKTQYSDGDNEWTWYVKDVGRPMYKAGAWKCPYHNGRAMLELETRLKNPLLPFQGEKVARRAG
ncbi:MAG: AGE family epimerase/isomerase [Asticcacaulis sp.]